MTKKDNYSVYRRVGNSIEYALSHSLTVMLSMECKMVTYASNVQTLCIPAVKVLPRLRLEGRFYLLTFCILETRTRIHMSNVPGKR